MHSPRKKRIPLNLDVMINRLYQAEGLDLSADGMYIYTRHTLIADSIVELLITGRGLEYNINAKVRHSQPGVGFGVSFMDMPSEMAERIRGLVEAA
jgi:hypothetical protein